MPSGNAEPGSLFGWPLSSLINRSRHNSARAWRATANNTDAAAKPSNTTLIICNRCRCANEIWLIQRSVPSKLSTVRRGPYHPCWVWGKTETTFLLFDNFSVFLCFPALHYIVMDRCWISKVYLLSLIIKHVADVLIREARVSIWLLKMLCQKHLACPCKCSWTITDQSMLWNDRL